MEVVFSSILAETHSFLKILSLFITHEDNYRIPLCFFGYLEARLFFVKGKMGSQFRLEVEIFSATHLQQKASFWELLDNKGKLDLNHILIMCVGIILLHGTCIRHYQEYYIYTYYLYHMSTYVVCNLYTKSIEREERREEKRREEKRREEKRREEKRREEKRREGMIIHET